MMILAMVGKQFYPSFYGGQIKAPQPSGKSLPCRVPKGVHRFLGALQRRGHRGRPWVDLCGKNWDL